MDPVSEVSQLCLQNFTLDEHTLLLALDQDGHDHHLERSDGRGEDDALLIPMDADDGPQESFGHAVGGLMHILVLSLLILVHDSVGFREIGAVLVDGTKLHGLAIGHETVDPKGVVSTRELVPVRSFQDEIGDAQPLREACQDPEVLPDLTFGILQVHVGGMRLEEMDLPDTDKGLRHLGLVPEDVHDLVGLQREIGMGADPEIEHGVHGGLRRRTEEERDIELVQPPPGYPVDLGIESLDVVPFLREFGLGDKERKMDLSVVRVIQFLPDQAVDLPHGLPAIGFPDVHSFDRIPFVTEVGLLDDIVVPFAEVASIHARAFQDMIK